MAQPTGTHSSYDAVGNREDLSDVIYLIDPTDTPFLTGCEKVDATATLHEWQTDSLAAAAANAQIEGDDATGSTATASVRRTNYTQISTKNPIVSGTQEAVVKAGRGSEMEYQIAKMAAELKRDMEHRLVGLNDGKAAGNDTTARETGGVLSWVATNDDVGGGGGASPTGDGSDARTDGTQRAFTEALLSAVLKLCWDAGGDPDCIMVGSFNKQEISQDTAFGGYATRYINNADQQLTATIDIYQSDFGTLEIKPNRFQRARDAWVLQMDMWAVAYLRGFRIVDLAKTGDAEKKQLLVEYALESRNEAASGLVADLSTS